MWQKLFENNLKLQEYHYVAKQNSLINNDKTELVQTKFTSKGCRVAEKIIEGGKMDKNGSKND